MEKISGIGQVLEHWGANIPEKDFDFGIRLFYKLHPKVGEPQITMDEFLKECTYFMLNCGFDE